MTALHLPIELEGLEGLAALPIAFLIAAAVLRIYTNFKQTHWFVNTLAFLTFGGTFFAISNLLIDIASTGYLVCRKDESRTCTLPLLYNAQAVISGIWQAHYAITAVFCWIIIPLCQSFLYTGGTRFTYRLKWALLRQAIYYLIVGGLGLIFLIYILATRFSFKFNEVKTFVVVLSNCWGLVLLVIFMGFGIVEIPRRLWKQSNSVERLTYLELKTPKLREELLDAEHEYRENVNILVNIADNIDSSNHYYSMIQQILNSSEVAPGRNSVLHNSQAQFPNPLTENFIATIHRKIKRATHCKERSQTLWNEHLKTTFFVQDIVNNLDSLDHKLTSSLKVLTGSRFDDFKLTVSWWWYVMIYPIVLKFLAVALSILGIIIVWSEMTFAARNPTLSIVALLFEAIPSNYSLQNFFAFIILVYMTTCTFFAILSVKLFNYYVIVPNGQTDGISLLWVGNNMLRLVPALIFNFLNLGQIGMFEKQSLVFNQFYGYFLDMAPALGKTLSTYFPCIILIPVTLVFFNYHIKLAKLFSLEDFFYESDTLEGRTLEGKSILATERSKMERQFQFDSRDYQPSNISSRSIDIETSRYTPDSDDHSTSPVYIESNPGRNILNSIRQFFNWNRITLQNSPSRVSLRSDHSDEYEQFIVRDP